MSVSLAGVPTMDRDALVAAVERHLDQGIVVIAPVASAQQAVAGIPPNVPLS